MAKNYQSPLGTTLDGGGGLGNKFPLKPKEPLRQKFTNFWCFKHEIKFSDNVVKTYVNLLFFSNFWGQISDRGDKLWTKKRDECQMGGGLVDFVLAKKPCILKMGRIYVVHFLLRKKLTKPGMHKHKLYHT